MLRHPEAARARRHAVPRWRLLPIALIIGLGGAGPSCVTTTDDEEPKTVVAQVFRGFDFVAIDGAHFSTQTTLGRVTVIVFITTYDLVSQIVVRRLAELERARSPRINVGAVVLEPPRNQPLVEAFAATLELPFPIALADQATLEARGSFGKVDVVPTVVVLNRKGVEVWRKEAAPAPHELESVLDDAAR